MPDEPTPSSNDSRPDPTPVRWWPAVLILVLTVAAALGLRFIPHLSQQHLNIRVAQLLAISLLLGLIWLLGLSRLPWRIRLQSLAALLGLLGGTAALFRIHGVTGDLIPILEPRWAKRQFNEPTPSVSKTNALTAPSLPVPGAADFQQFLGPQRNGVAAFAKLATNWVTHPPTLLWRHPVGAAWSGYVVAGRLAITQEQRDQSEVVACQDLLTGAPVWSHPVPARYFNTLAGEGPRATPTVSSNRVFAQGATGMLLCLDLASGKPIWSRDVFKDAQSSIPSWGQSSSPLILGDWVIIAAGGRNDHSLIAYRTSDGSIAWHGGDEGDTYSSPLHASLLGTPQILLFAGSLTSHDATTGKVLWKHPWPGGHPHVATPLVVSSSDVVISSGYGTGSARVRVARDTNGTWSAKQVWRSNRLKAKFTNLVVLDGFLYGLDDGIMACLDLGTGELKWKDGKYGHGQVLLCGSLLLVMAESGEVVLLDPKPDQLHELSRFTALTGKTWNPPALAGELIVTRNDKEAACFRLPVLP